MQRKLTQIQNSDILYYLGVLIPLILLPFVVSKKIIDPAVVPRFIFLSSYAILLLASFCLFSRKPLYINAVFIYIFYALFVLDQAISISYAANVPEALFETSKNLLFLILFVSLVFIYSDQPTLFNDSVKIGITIFVVISLTYGIIQFINFVSRSDLNHEQLYAIASVFTNKNIFSHVLSLLLPFICYYFISSRGLLRLQYALLLLIMLSFIVILLTKTSWLVIILDLFFLSIIFALRKLLKTKIIDRPNGKRSFALNLIAIGLISIALSFYFYSKFGTTSTITKQIDLIKDIHKGSTGDRIALWKKSIQVFNENPVAGKGVGSWKIEILKKGSQNIRSEDHVTFYRSPHNEYIQILVEQGIIGLLIYILLIAAILFKAFRSTLYEQNYNQLGIFLVYNLVILNFLIISFFSFPRQRMETGFILTIALVFLILNDKKNNESAKTVLIRNPKMIWIGLFSIAVFLLYSGIKRYHSELSMGKLYKAQSVQNWNKVLKNAENASNNFYNLDIYASPVVWYKGIANYNMGKYKQAFTDFQTSCQINPYHIYSLNNLGSCYLLLSDTNNAIAFYKKTLKLAPNFNETLLNLAILYFKHGASDSSYQYVQQIDLNYEDERYALLLNLLLLEKVNSTIKYVTEADLVIALQSVKDNPTWLKNIFIKSKENNYSLEKQLLLDVIFVLEKQKGSITKQQAAQIRAKYGCAE